MIIKTLFSVGLLTVSIMSQADTLQVGDILSFNTAAGSQVSGIASGGTVFDSANLDSFNGLIIGTVQPSYPDIDQQWLSAQFGVMGNHLTTSAVTVINGSELNFSGWTMSIGGSDYNFGTMQGTATYTFDGNNFTLDYHWDAITDNVSIGIGPRDVSVYDLKLVGTVSSVPLPAAAWFFGSGLLSLIAVTKRKKSTANLWANPGQSIDRPMG